MRGKVTCLSRDSEVPMGLGGYSRMNEGPQKIILGAWEYDLFEQKVFTDVIKLKTRSV
jgi:hypothetical protein